MKRRKVKTKQWIAEKVDQTVRILIGKGSTDKDRYITICPFCNCIIISHATKM